MLGAIGSIAKAILPGLASGAISGGSKQGGGAKGASLDIGSPSAPESISDTSGSMDYLTAEDSVDISGEGGEVGEAAE